MNGEPQDSATSSRQDVESLRFRSDQISPGYSDHDTSRSNLGLRREHSDGIAASHGTQSAHVQRAQQIPLGVSHGSPVSPNSHTQHFPFPARTHSLGEGTRGPHWDSHRQALARLRQQREGDDAWRRMQGSSTSIPQNISQNIPQAPRRHASSLSGGTEHAQTDFSRLDASYGSTIRRFPSSIRQMNHSRSSEYVLPKWQPDSDATDCPICGHPFSFFYRKHHCRKCGRVVCANCSPHRITIPRQYIVNPPPPALPIDLTGDPAQEYVEDGDSARLAADQLRLSLNGGQEVRLCNPCVPDPNPLPPPPYLQSSSNTAALTQQISLQRTPSGGIPASRRRSHGVGMPAGYQRYDGLTQAYPLTGRRPSQIQSSSLDADSMTQYGSAPSGFSPYIPRHTHPRNHRHHASLSVLPLGRHQAVFDAMTSTEQPPEDSISRQIPEEDECPICHEELPAKGPDGSEADREAHVASCIEGHFSSSRPKDSSMPRPETAVAAAVVASAATPAQAGSSVPNNIMAGPSTRRRTTGMVVYNATEKDCMGEDGATQECIICFEDFEPGIEMGRLECLCKFHKACIRSWWDTKGVGACPVHQGGLI